MELVGILYHAFVFAPHSVGNIGRAVQLLPQLFASHIADFLCNSVDSAVREVQREDSRHNSLFCARHIPVEDKNSPVIPLNRGISSFSLLDSLGSPNTFPSLRAALGALLRRLPKGIHAVKANGLPYLRRYFLFSYACPPLSVFFIIAYQKQEKKSKFLYKGLKNDYCCDKIKVLHKLDIFFTIKFVFFSIKIQALLFFTFFMVKIVCVATNGAMCFLCVVPFGATHFFYFI